MKTKKILVWNTTKSQYDIKVLNEQETKVYNQNLDAFYKAKEDAITFNATYSNDVEAMKDINKRLTDAANNLSKIGIVMNTESYVLY